MLLLLPALPCADALPDRRAAAAVMADPLTARLRKSLLVLILIAKPMPIRFNRRLPRRNHLCKRHAILSFTKAAFARRSRSTLLHQCAFTDWLSPHFDTRFAANILVRVATQKERCTGLEPGAVRGLKGSGHCGTIRIPAAQVRARPSRCPPVISYSLSYFPAVTELAGRVVNWFTTLVTGSEIPPACSDDTL